MLRSITWTTALSNSMKLWVTPCRATQDGWVMVENSEKMCSTGETEVFSHVQPFANPWTTSVLCLWEFAGKNTGMGCNFFSRGSSQPRDWTRVSWTVSRLFTIWATREAHNGTPLQYSCFENAMNSMKRQKDRTLTDVLPRSVGVQYAAGEQWRNNSRKNVKIEPKQKQHPVVDVTGDGSKDWCCKEQYYIGTFNVRSMNQGELEEIKQEMARVNVNILGVSKLKCTGMGEFNWDGHYIYYCGQECLRRNGVAIMVHKRVLNAVFGCSFKNNRMIPVRVQGRPFNITVIQVYAPTNNAEEAEVEWFYEELQDLLELIPSKDVHFIIGDWNAKVGSQETPGVTGKFCLGVRNDACKG